MKSSPLQKILFLFILLLFIFRTCTPKEERSFLENFMPIFRLAKDTLKEVLNQIRQSEGSRQKFQRSSRAFKTPGNITTFPCNLSMSLRSEEIPKSAHEVRPGDIDVIAAMGDSLTAGFGVSAGSLVEVIGEYKGRSFSIGGDGTWRTVVTLPNILKVFNPNLIGYSVGLVTSIDKGARFNVAEGGALSRDMPYMAKVLVERLKSDPEVDIQKHWKMVTLLVGANDFCAEFCYDNMEHILKEHRRDMLEVLRTLQANLPRTIVNIIPPPHLHQLTQEKDKPAICYLTHSFYCPCLAGLTHASKQKFYGEAMSKWQAIDIEVSNLPEFDGDDFTVIPHNFMPTYVFPRVGPGKLNHEFLSPDCFHWSERSHARVGNDLWNSILEPFGNKSTDGAEIFSKFHCPTEEHPYIFTRRNSVYR